MDKLFDDRHHAGRLLAKRLTRYKDAKNTVVLGLPRGGVVVAFEVAKALGLPLDVFVVRKIGFPGNEEYAIGAIASGGTHVLDDALIERARLSPESVMQIVSRETQELERRERAYRDSAPLDLEGKTVIVVDDGLATGFTMRAAVTALNRRGVRGVVVAVPVGSPDVCGAFRRDVEEAVCAYMPHPLYAVGAWYGDFSQTTDAEVRDLLSRAASGFCREAVNGSPT